MIKIMQPKIEDLDQLMSLWQEQYNFHYNIDPVYYVPFSDKLRDRIQADMSDMIDKKESHILVAKDREELVGFITFGDETDDYYDANITHYGVLKEILVTSDRRGTGVGKQLIESAEKHLIGQGVTKIMIQCSSLNPIALAIYKHLGYIPRQELLYKIINAN